MAGILEALFGADGIGGQSGAVGKVADQGILNTVLGGAGKVIAPVGNAAVGGLGDWISDVVTKNPLEILKNPMSVLNDRGEPSWTRVLFPEFRRNDMRNKEMAAKAKQLEATTASLSMLGDMGKFLQGLKPDQRAPYVQQMEQAGVPSDQVDLALGQANAADQQAEIARQGIAQALPDLPSELVDASTFTPEQAITAITTAERAKAVQARADQRAAAVGARADREAGLRASREARLAAQGPPKTFAQKAAERRAERASNRVFDAEAASMEAIAGPLIGSITDPTLRGKLRAKAVAQAKTAAEQVINEALPPTTRKNLAGRKAAKAALKSLPQDVGLDSPILQDTPIPTDPVERVKAAEVLGTQLLEAGFPPDKAAAELLRRGFKPEELPE